MPAVRGVRLVISELQSALDATPPPFWENSQQGTLLASLALLVVYLLVVGDDLEKHKCGKFSYLNFVLYCFFDIGH